MVVWRQFKIRETERGLMFREGEFVRVLKPGRYRFLDVLRRLRVDVVSVRSAWLRHPDLDVIARSGALGDEATVLDLTDRQRALVWLDGRFVAALRPGLYAVWTVFRDVRVETIDVVEPRFEHPDLKAILAVDGNDDVLTTVTVPAGHAGVEFLDGDPVAVLPPGRHAFWKGAGEVRVEAVDLRESTFDIAGQEIMTADKVTLRLNAVVTSRVTDPRLAATQVEDHRQTLYREAQLALRAIVGTRELDALLAEKDAVARELEAAVRERAATFGVEDLSIGIRDIILPGEMKELLNKVIEARKAAEAVAVTRREETAAMRSQANTAKLLDANPTLMRMRELEALERIAGAGKLNVVLGEKGLAERVINLL